MNCSYCNRPAECVRASVIWGAKFARQWAWRCVPCAAYVGCHGETKEPLGTLAKEPRRRARKSAHASFDPLWKQGHYRRSHAYQLLADFLEIPVGDCHIANFDENRCALVVVFATRHRAAIFQNAMAETGRMIQEAARAEQTQMEAELFKRFPPKENT